MTRPELEADWDDLLECGSADDETNALETAALALAMGFAGPVEPVPEALRARLEADAARHFAATSRPPRSTKGWKLAAVAGWLAAAASWLLMAWPTGSSPRLDRPDKIKPIAWTAPLQVSDHPLARGASGQVAWNQEGQTGLLRLEGLAGVGAGKGVYQLWIFDDARDSRYPVDGGTFEVADARGTTVVPVRARLRVGRPSLFAITLEPPGGVVVSDRQRIMLTASFPTRKP